MNNYWQKQAEKPLFEELEWNKPERRDQAGRLLILGGTIHSLTAPAKVYEIAKQQGIGEAKVVLPDATKKLLHPSALQDFVFLPSTSSGEFSKDGLDELISYSNWADTILLPGDSGRNSQTTLLFSELIKSYKERVVVARDALDILLHDYNVLLNREHTTIIASFADLQKLSKLAGEEVAITYSIDLNQLVEFLHNFTQEYAADIVTLHQNQLIVASNGNISTTKIKSENADFIWRTEFSAIASCYQTWSPYKPFEALTHTAHLILV